MEHRSYMRRTRRSGLLLAYLVLSILFSSLVQAENTTKYDESIEHEIVILSEHNHHDEAFTQGLEMYNGSIYESTGLYGHSSLREVNPWTGDIIRSKSFNDSIFSEGITVYNNTIIMLTWETQIAYVFEMDNLSQISSYEYEGEGWGICFDGNSFVMSNGTSTVSFRNPETFEIERTVSVTDSFGNLINRINELECVNTPSGPRVLANIWQQDRILVIDPSNGTVLGDYDASHLSSKNDNGYNNVLNGIAHISDSEFWITGKNWSSMYLVQMTNLSGVEANICVSSCEDAQDSSFSNNVLITIGGLILLIMFIFLRQDDLPADKKTPETVNRHNEQLNLPPLSQEDEGILNDR